MKTLLILSLLTITAALKAEDIYFYKNNKIARKISLKESAEHFTLLVDDKLSKQISKKEAKKIKDNMNSLFWEFAYKQTSKSPTCLGKYMTLDVNNESTTVCLNEKTKVAKSYAFLVKMDEFLTQK